MKKNILLAAAAVTFAISASAQNLNPTVEVTNDFLGKTVDASKPLGKMEVPDSVMKFDLDFDYSVLSSPYKGGYDFSPYLLEMKPAADAYKAGKFYLRAGAGYTLNPEFDLVWSPKLKNQALHLNVFAKNRSYVGKYHRIGYQYDDENDVNRLESYKDDEPYNGYDVNSIVGVNGKIDFTRSYADFAVSYEGIETKLSTPSGSDLGVGVSRTNHYNTVNVRAGYHSNDAETSNFKYDADVDYRFGIDDTSISSSPSWVNMKSNDFGLKAELGPVIDELHAVLVGVGTEVTSYSSTYRSDSGEDSHSQVGHLYIAPHYVYSSYRLKLSAGVKLDMAISSKNWFMGYQLNQNKGQVIYPDVHVDYQLIRENLDVYAAVTGGIDRNPYYDMKQDYHFYNPAAMLNYFSMNSIDRVNASLGFRGNLASVFRFDVSAGFAVVDGYRHFGLAVPEGGEHSRNGLWTMYWPSYYAFDDANVSFAKMSFVLDLAPVVVDGGIRYSHASMGKDETIVNGFGPVPVLAQLNAHYNWKGRISAGVMTEYNSPVKGYSWGDTVIPGFLNLGIDASYAFNRKLSFWLKGDNLLCQSIQRTPLYAEKGIKFTAGICLNL